MNQGLPIAVLSTDLKALKITLDRKVLADLAVTEPEIFAQIIEQAKAGKPSAEVRQKQIRQGGQKDS